MTTKSDKDTELKIKNAASKIFLEKGFAASKTRDIAEAANVNLALVNYYFRSKKRLFDIVMFETLKTFFSQLVEVLNDDSTSLKEKLQNFVNAYMDILSENQNVASFILNTVRESPEEYFDKIGLIDKAKESVFVRQFQKAVIDGDIPPLNPIHFLLNIMGLTVFPFIAQPMISAASGVPKEIFLDMIQERKRLIPLWIESMLRVR